MRRVAKLGLAAVVALALSSAAVLAWMRWMPGSSFRGPPPALSPEEQRIEIRLRDAVGSLSGPLSPRSLAHAEKLEAAAAFLEHAFAEVGYEVSTQPFEVNGRTVRNVEAELRGGRELVVVGAHYDSFAHVPGANDNGSGAAAVLEIARLLRGKVLARTVLFVLFVNEEPPYFQTATMGSRVHARRARERGEPIALMINIDMIGCYRDDDVYDLPFSALFGKRGDFVVFLANPSSSGRLRQSVGLFRAAVQFPSEGLIVPEFYSDAAASDHASYWREGYDAVYVTDTGPMRGCPWHGADDTPDAIDFPKMSRVVAGLASVVQGLADGRSIRSSAVTSSSPK